MKNSISWLKNDRSYFYLQLISSGLSYYLIFPSQIFEFAFQILLQVVFSLIRCRWITAFSDLQNVLDHTHFYEKKISKKSFLRLCFVCGIHLENRPMSCKRMKWLKHVKSIRVNIENFPNKWRPLKINVNYSCQLLCVLNFFSCLCLEVSSACIFPMKSYFWALD